MNPPSALITGGSRGIGLGIATHLVSKGWGVTLAARRIDQLEAAREQLVHGGGSVHIISADMADDDALAGVLHGHESAFGSLNSLVLAAGVGSAGPIEGYPMNRFDKQFAVNVRAPYALVSRALPLLRSSAADSGRLSRIVAIASLEAVHPEPGLSAYGSSKAALVSLVRSINAEENANAVAASAISPGFVATELSAWTTDSIPFDQMITVDDVVKAFELIVSVSSNAIIPHIVLNRRGAGEYHA